MKLISLVRVVNFLVVGEFNHLLNVLKNLNDGRKGMLQIKQLLVHLRRVLVGCVPDKPLFFEVHA